MTVTSPMSIARQQLVTLLTAEFGPDEYQISSDRLHKSLGRDGVTRIGVSPGREQTFRENISVLEYFLEVQFYGPWEDSINPVDAVDPEWIETQAERFKRALHGNDPDTNTMWYFVLEQIQYPNDPTGNVTRFEAQVKAVGTNSALIETTG